MSSFINTIPATIGEKLSEVDTPALIVSRPALQRNLQRLQDFVDNHNNDQDNNNNNKKKKKLTYRPHMKTHKCPNVANLQINNYNAQGVCVQVLDEAEAMIENGIKDVFLSNSCIGHKKIKRLCDLAKKGQVSVVVDNFDNLQDIVKMTELTNTRIDVLIEVNAGQNRCGIDVVDDNGVKCVELARVIESSSQLSFKGIHCYNGAIQHTRSKEERCQQVMDMPVERATIAVKALNDAGISVQVVTGGGTGTFPFESSSGIYNEIQPGSYCFMDVDYGVNEDGQDVFENALFLHAMVISKSDSGSGPVRAVLDAGLKASSYDSGMPVPIVGFVDGHVSKRLTPDIVELQNGGDEHSVLVGDYAKNFTVGETVRLIPGHVDPTVNMHQYLVVVDDDGTGDEPAVVDIWTVAGRSPGY